MDVWYLTLRRWVLPTVSKEIVASVFKDSSWTLNPRRRRYHFSSKRREPLTPPRSVTSKTTGILDYTITHYV
jgi:hypothetical protein